MSPEAMREKVRQNSLWYLIEEISVEK